MGTPEKALKKLKEEGYIKDFKLKFFSEIDKDTIKSYCVIHNVDKSLNLGSITNIKGIDLPYCDLWIAGFSCQDISCAGKMRGFNFDSEMRSSLGWEMIRLLKEVSKKPRSVIFENVAMITSKRFKDTLNLFKNDLEQLGYSLYDSVLNVVDFGIPQIRKRYFLIAILDNEFEYEFPKSKQNEYEMINDTIIRFNKKNREDIIYEIDLKKNLKGGICVKDKHSKFAMSSRVYSVLENAPTLTANNVKILVEGE